MFYVRMCFTSVQLNDAFVFCGGSGGREGCVVLLMDIWWASGRFSQ